MLRTCSSRLEALPKLPLAAEKRTWCYRCCANVLLPHSALPHPNPVATVLTALGLRQVGGTEKGQEQPPRWPAPAWTLALGLVSSGQGD